MWERKSHEKILLPPFLSIEHSKLVLTHTEMILRTWGHWQQASELSVNSEICNPKKSATDSVGGRKSCNAFQKLLWSSPVTCAATEERTDLVKFDCFHTQTEICTYIYMQIPHTCIFLPACLSKVVQLTQLSTFLRSGAFVRLVILLDMITWFMISTRQTTLQQAACKRSYLFPKSNKTG